jgi:dUTP pyrophosphatase
MVKIKLLDPAAKIPSYAHEGDACFDLYANKSITIQPNKVVKVPLGIATEIPEGYRVDIVPRSGLSLEGIAIANSPGVVDSNFRGEWNVLMYSLFGDIKYIEKGERIAQGKLEKCNTESFEVVDKLSVTDRGIGGYGSSGRF